MLYQRGHYTQSQFVDTRDIKIGFFDIQLSKRKKIEFFDYQILNIIVSHVHHCHIERKYW